MLKLSVLAACFVPSALLACGNKTPAQGNATPGATASAPTGTAPAQPTAGGLLHKLNSSMLYLGATDTDYFTSLTLEAGTLTAGSTVDAVNAQGQRASFTVTRLSVRQPDDSKIEAKTLTQGQEGELELRLVSGKVSELGGEFFLVDAGAKPPQAAIADAAAAAQAKQAARGQVTCTLNGAPWPTEIAATGVGYYRQGVKLMNGGGKPYMLIALVATTPPDDRQLTITLNGWQARAGAIDKQLLEASFNGAPDGNKDKPQWLGWKPSPDYAKGAFALTVTKWEAHSPTQAVMDARFDATLLGVLGSKQAPAEFSACTLTNVAVTLYDQAP